MRRRRPARRRSRTEPKPKPTPPVTTGRTAPGDDCTARARDAGAHRARPALSRAALLAAGAVAVLVAGCVACAWVEGAPLVPADAGRAGGGRLGVVFLASPRRGVRRLSRRARAPAPAAARPARRPARRRLRSSSPRSPGRCSCRPMPGPTGSTDGSRPCTAVTRMSTRPSEYQRRPGLRARRRGVAGHDLGVRPGRSRCSPELVALISGSSAAAARLDLQGARGGSRARLRPARRETCARPAIRRGARRLEPALRCPFRRWRPQRRAHGRARLGATRPCRRGPQRPRRAGVGRRVPAQVDPPALLRAACRSRRAPPAGASTTAASRLRLWCSWGSRPGATASTGCVRSARSRATPRARRATRSRTGSSSSAFPTASPSRWRRSCWSAGCMAGTGGAARPGAARPLGVPPARDDPVARALVHDLGGAACRCRGRPAGAADLARLLRLSAAADDPALAAPEDEDAVLGEDAAPLRVLVAVRRAAARARSGRGCRDTSAAARRRPPTSASRSTGKLKIRRRSDRCAPSVFVALTGAPAGTSASPRRAAASCSSARTVTRPSGPSTTAPASAASATDIREAGAEPRDAEDGRRRGARGPPWLRSAS